MSRIAVIRTSLKVTYSSSFTFEILVHTNQSKAIRVQQLMF